MTAIDKLKLDIVRYKHDSNINVSWKLLLINEFWPVFLLRIEEYVDTGELSKVNRKILHFFTIIIRPLIRGLSGTRIMRGAKIGGGLLLHGSVGITIASDAIIGDNCTIFPGAAVIHKANEKFEGSPVIGNNVKLTHGCKVIGNIRIGDNVIIGANSVVLKDIPDNSIAVGIPASFVKKA